MCEDLLAISNGVLAQCTGSIYMLDGNADGDIMYTTLRTQRAARRFAAQYYLVLHATSLKALMYCANISEPMP